MQQQYGFVQQPCSRCGTTVWISPQAGMGICPSCHTQNSLSGAAAAAAGAAGVSPVGGFAAFSPMMIAGAFGAMLLFAIVSVGGWYVKSYVLGGGGKGKASYSSIGVDAKAPDADLLMSNVTSLAQKWKKDAVFWSVNYQAVRADGTVLVDKGAVVEFISPSKVSSASKKVREDSIKRFTFGSSGVDYSKQWDATNQWKNVSAPALPGCSIKKLLASLASKGLSGSKTVRVTYDPQFQRGEQAWRVIGEDPKMDAWFSMATCAEVTP